MSGIEIPGRGPLPSQGQQVEITKVTRYLKFAWMIPPAAASENGSGSRVVVFILPDSGEAIEMAFEPLALAKFRADLAAS